MPDDVVVDATAASSPATTDSAPADTSAGTLNTDQAAQNGQQPSAPTPFHLHPDWQRMQRREREATARATQLEQRLQQLERAGQQNGRPQATLEQQQAIQALRELQALDPEGSKQTQRLDQLERMLQGLVQQQRTALTTQGRSQLADMAREGGLPTDEKSLAVIENAVAVYLADNPEAVQRFKNHDLSVIPAAFKEFNDTFLGKLRRESQAAVVEKKTAAAAIPTPPRGGGPPGPAAPVKVTAANEPEVREGIRERIRAAFGQLRE